MSRFDFTVFTPTYNRCGDLPKVYNCLKKQTKKEFEWIVIDDGSTDGTKNLVKEYQELNEFSIKYIFQMNSGKHVAQNKAVEMAKGELFLPLDSDDEIVTNALEEIWMAWESIPEEKRKNFSGVGVHCMDKKMHRIGAQWPEDNMISNDLEMHFKYHITEEKWGAIRTDIMKIYKNAEVKGHFLSEGTVWYRIARKYNKLYINKNLRIYEVHEDSVSNKIEHDKNYNFESFLCSTCIYINEFSDYYLKYDKKNAIKYPLVLAKKCIENNYPIFVGESALMCLVHPMYAKILLILASLYKVIEKIF